MFDFRPAEDVVHAALAAHVAGDWETFVSLIDAPSLDEWRVGFVRVNTHVRSAEEWRAELPKAPLDAVERLAERMARPVREFVANLERHFAGVHTLDELAALSSGEVVVRMLQAEDPVDRMNRLADVAYAASGIQPPPSAYYTRTPRHFTISQRWRKSDRRVRIVFREDGTSLTGDWTVVRDASGAWRLVMRAKLLYLPGGHVTYIDDPVVVAYISTLADQ